MSLHDEAVIGDALTSMVTIAIKMDGAVWSLNELIKAAHAKSREDRGANFATETEKLERLALLKAVKIAGTLLEIAQTAQADILSRMLGIEKKTILTITEIKNPLQDAKKRMVMAAGKSVKTAEEKEAAHDATIIEIKTRLVNKFIEGA